MYICVCLGEKTETLGVSHVEACMLFIMRMKVLTLRAILLIINQVIKDRVFVAYEIKWVSHEKDKQWICIHWKGNVENLDYWRVVYWQTYVNLTFMKGNDWEISRDLGIHLDVEEFRKWQLNITTTYDMEMSKGVERPRGTWLNFGCT